MSEKLAGKRAIVTGGATGIGYGIAKRFIGEGARVIITDIDAQGGTSAAPRRGQAAAPGIPRSKCAWLWLWSGGFFP